MTSSAKPGQAEPPPWRGWIVIPSWLGSLLVHLSCLVLLLTFARTPPPRGDFPGEGGDSFRKVGIRMESGNPGPAGAEAPKGPQPADSQTIAQEVPQPPVLRQELQQLEATVPQPVSVTLPVPSASPALPVIGAGPVSSLSSVNMDRLISPSAGGGRSLEFGGAGGSATGTGSGTGGPAFGSSGGTTFIGIGAVGRRFVYIIDRSSSMAADHALQAAKLELLASIQRLDESQQFQIVFYNNTVHTLDTQSGRFDVFRGTDHQRLKVSEQLRDVVPAGGTHHLPALIEGLKFNPDVIFLLTDGAAESALTRKDLEEVKRYNRHGTRIHCIEFGRGSHSALDDSANFLRTLSQEHQGRYVYRNVRDILTGSTDSPVPRLSPAAERTLP